VNINSFAGTGIWLEDGADGAPSAALLGRRKSGDAVFGASAGELPLVAPPLSLSTLELLTGCAGTATPPSKRLSDMSW